MDGESSIPSTTPGQTANFTEQHKSSCQVCQIESAKMHFGAICCNSCKLFFRRNANFDLNGNQCVFGEGCDITINSRRACRYCRLKKCYSVGMQKELLRASHQKRKLQTKENKTPSSLPTIHPLDLLRNDRSLLNSEQWNYLSNIVNVYNMKSPIAHVRQLLQTHSTYPMKLRIKMTANSMLEVIGSMYAIVLPFVEKLPHFSTLSINDRSMLMERNIKNVGGYSGIVLCRDCDFYSSPVFKIGFPSIYGPVVANFAMTIYERTDNDASLIKLLLPILMFSTGSDLILSTDGYETDTNKHRLLSNTIQILFIQNFYVDILFKYMIYRYGYEQTCLRFAALIKSSLDQSMCAYRATEIQKH